MLMFHLSYKFQFLITLVFFSLFPPVLQLNVQSPIHVLIDIDTDTNAKSIVAECLPNVLDHCNANFDSLDTFTDNLNSA